MHVRVINPTTTAVWDEETLETYVAAASPGTTVSVVSLDAGTASVECRRDIALVTPGIIAAARQAEADGCDGVIVDCMADPGVHAAREAVSIPVIGPSEVSLHVAASLGHGFSIIAVDEDHRHLMRERARRTGVASRLVSVRSFGIPVLELDDDPARTLHAAAQRARNAVLVDGADVIVPGCTGLAGLAPTIADVLAADGLDVTVIDPPVVALRQLETIIRLGLTSSRVTYPHTRPAIVAWPA